MQRTDGSPLANQSSVVSCRTPAVPLRVVTSPDKTQPLRRLAADFTKTKPSVGGRCVEVTITEHVSAAMASRLHDDADPDELDQMDVWMPESQLWLRSLGTAKNADGPISGGRQPAQRGAVAGGRRDAPSDGRGARLARAEACPRRHPRAGRGTDRMGRQGASRVGGVPLDETDPRVSTAKAQTAVAMLYNRVG
jgi:hypothetical protein